MVDEIRLRAPEQDVVALPLGHRGSEEIHVGGTENTFQIHHVVQAVIL